VEEQWARRGEGCAGREEKSMNKVPEIAGVVGVLLFALAVVGRFYSLPTITLAGRSFAASTFLLLAITAFVVGIYAELLSARTRK
jgi:hypothetical protein